MTSDGSDDGRFEVTVVAHGSKQVDAESVESAKALAHADWAHDIGTVIVEDTETGEQHRYEQ